MGKFVDKIFKKARSASDKMDQYQEAITFAEADAYEYVKKPLETKQQDERPGKLLVIGKGSEFPKDIVDYALEMAKRMSYEILAMNTAPLKDESFKLFASSQNKNCQEFKELSAKNIESFHKQAEKKAIPFEHAIKFSEIDTAIEEIRKEYGTIDFVISGAEEKQISEREENRERPSKEIFVYSMV
ncbi:MAG: hypothetical protein JRJ76_02035 [Deltaproteobacteria bacterium]|nr:hypothetical protein [Deltaproteobacteria bacterium]